MSKGIKTIAQPISKGVGAVLTGGTSLIPGSPTKPLGDIFGTIATGGLAGLPQFGNTSGNQSAPVIQGKQDPLNMLTMSGGAPLLTNIALGAGVEQSLMGYFGASGDYKTWFDNLNDSDKKAIQGLHDQLTNIQTNTDLRNQAVQKLADDFPHIMATKIPQYSAMADDATQKMMTQALDQISAKQSASGALSSGATAAAAARAGASIGMDKLNYGTGLALQDFATQYNNASALQSFQQKMLGQGATQGFNAIQNALARNTGINTAQAELQYKADAAESQKQAGLWGSLGALGGTAIGATLGGPSGAAIGNKAGKTAANMFTGPSLNTDLRDIG